MRRRPLIICVLLALGVGLLACLVVACRSTRSLPGPDPEQGERLWWRLMQEAGTDSGGLPSRMAREVADFQDLYERNLAWRVRAVAEARCLHGKIAAGRPLAGGDLESLNLLLGDGLLLVAGLRRYANVHEPWRRIDDQQLRARRLAPVPPALRFQGLALSTAASLALFDNYLLSGSVLAEDDQVRRALDRGDVGLGVKEDRMEALKRAYLDPGRRLALRSKIIEYRAGCGAIPAESDPDPQTAWLRMAVEQSPSFGVMTSFLGTLSLAEAVEGAVDSVGDDLQLLGEHAVGGLSRFFGNSVGLVETRKGKLHGKREVMEAIRAVLRPGDILLEKTPFRLTDKLIPGHWGHVAIWLGTPEDLRGLGIWADPLVQRHAKVLERGRSIVEALRDGVQINGLDRFLNVDDLAVLRRPGLPRPSLAQHLLRCLRQVGKEYDFNFDVQSPDRIVCSELVYQVFIDIPWPTDRTLGRWTISPDQVARRSLTGDLEVVDLWHDGRRSDSDRLALLRNLLQE